MITILMNFVENEIYGETLMLLIEDFEEFKSLVTAPLARLKIKKWVKEKTQKIPQRRGVNEVQIFTC